jgi:hypothetical protein
MARIFIVLRMAVKVGWWLKAPFQVHPKQRRFYDYKMEILLVVVFLKVKFTDPPTTAFPGI